MSNSVDPDETAHYEPSHLDLCCLQKPIVSPVEMKGLNVQRLYLLVIIIVPVHCYRNNFGSFHIAPL